MREIKFQIIYNNEIIGEEKIVDGNWQWMVYKLNPDGKEKWNVGYFPASENLIRRQFTGLKDKTGKEIYEGDILKEEHPRGWIYRVIKVPGGFAINQFQDELNDIVFYNPLADMQTTSWIQSNCEILGNIYEHPHLLSLQVKQD